MTELAQGDAALAAKLRAASIELDVWLRHGPLTHVARVSQGAGVAVVKVGDKTRIEREFELTRGFSHPALLLPESLFRGDRQSALLIPFFDGAPIVTAARSQRPQAVSRTMRQNLPIAFGYELSDVGVSAYSHCGAAGEESLRGWMAQIGDALSVVHAGGILHLDVAPDNILVRGAQAKLLDFGLARRALVAANADDDILENAPIGSAAYLAPELAMGRYSAAADWYSLGVVLFQALTGGLPFEGGGPEVLVQKQSLSAPRAADVCKEVSAEWDHRCERLLARDPHKRLAHWDTSFGR